MKNFINRFSDLIKDVMTGFDRIVFKGFILPLMSASEVMNFCRSRNILNKDYKNRMLSQTQSIITTTEHYAIDNCGRSVTHIPTWRVRKEELAHERQQKDQISS